MRPFFVAANRYSALGRQRLRPAVSTHINALGAYDTDCYCFGRCGGSAVSPRRNSAPASSWDTASHSAVDVVVPGTTTRLPLSHNRGLTCMQGGSTTVIAP